ncbi:hypothetical protein AB0G00_23955 [Nocardia salmonicida]|uniref:hypothetical protein n=1 Tax=Nocardia salmonicida TaxID=53431 RepID=UPI0033E84181
MTYEIGTLVNVTYYRRTKRGMSTSVRQMEIASSLQNAGTYEGYQVRKPGTTGKGGGTVFNLKDIAPVEAPAAEPVRELKGFNIPSKRTRTTGPRHPLEREPLPEGYWGI